MKGKTIHGTNALAKIRSVVLCKEIWQRSVLYAVSGERGTMAGRITIQDIANALGVSRNTVSKAINDTGILAEDTREKVLKKAMEMGYKQFAYMNAASDGQEETRPSGGTAGEIALLTMRAAGTSNFLSIMLERFQGEFYQLGYSFTIHWVRREDAENMRLPVSFDREKVSGIICIETLDYDYCTMLCGLQIPILFVDSPVTAMKEPLKADCIYPDNQSNTYVFVREMVRRGKMQIGFIGEIMHCQSFFERYLGYRNAMYLMGMPDQDEYCILGNKEGVRYSTTEDYQEYLLDSFSKMKSMPEVFICANDYVALDTMRVFKKLGISVPEDVWLCGFDDAAESRIITLSLTTIHIHSHIMGHSAAYLLLSRMREASLQFRAIHTQTSLVYRESTGD